MAIDINEVEFDFTPIGRVDRAAVTAQALEFAGVPAEVTPKFVDATDKLVEYEAVWDQNAVVKISHVPCGFAPDGYPEDGERGLMQLRPKDFAFSHVPGTSHKIYDPVASIAAGWHHLSLWYAIDLITGEGLEEFMDRFAQNPGRRYGQPDSAEVRRSSPPGPNTVS